MDIDQVISQYFKNENIASQYIRNRLLGNYDQAPPQTVNRFIEEFPTDLLQQLIRNLNDKHIFWNACFKLYQGWRSSKNANQESIRGLTELVTLIYQINKSEPEILASEKERWKHELKSTKHTIQLCETDDENLIFIQYLNMIHLFDVWSDNRWLNLCSEILNSNDNVGIVQYDILLIVFQHLKWDRKLTGNLFEWTLKKRNLPSNFFNQYFFQRLCGCGNRKSNESLENQKNCQMDFIKDILFAQRKFFNEHSNDKTKIIKLGNLLGDAIDMLHWKSFECLNNENIKLLRLEIDKLQTPPSSDEKTIITTEAKSPPNYMSSRYSATTLAAA